MSVNDRVRNELYQKSEKQELNAANENTQNNLLSGKRSFKLRLQWPSALTVSFLKPNAASELESLVVRSFYKMGLKNFCTMF